MPRQTSQRPYGFSSRRRSEYDEGYDDGYDDALREARRDIGRDFGRSRPKKRSKAQKSNPWVAHLKRFKFRKKRRNESTQDYLVARRGAGSLLPQ